MEIQIDVAADRSLKVSNEHLGTVGEDNATVLNFTFDAKIPAGARVLIFSNRKGSFRKELIEDSYKIPIDITLCDYLDMQVEINGEEVLWYSDTYRFKLGKSINHKEENSL